MSIAENVYNLLNEDSIDNFLKVKENGGKLITPNVYQFNDNSLLFLDENNKFRVVEMLVE